jgi:hypothetical protein
MRWHTIDDIDERGFCACCPFATEAEVLPPAVSCAT